jgi:hypothetical protein
MQCPEHGLATAEDGKCVRCRREDEEANAKALDAATGPARMRGTIVGGALVVVGIGIAARLYFASLPNAPTPIGAADAAASSVATPKGAPAVAAPLATLEPSGVDAASPADPAATPAEDALARAMREVEVTMYCRPSACERTRQWMMDQGYMLKERNVDADPNAEIAWRHIAPDGTMPAFEIGPQKFSGFDPDRVTNAVRFVASRRLQK